MRIEAILIRSIQKGKAYSDNYHDINKEGKLGTWARDFLKYFTPREQVSLVLLSKLGSWGDYDAEDRLYVAMFFFSVLPEVISEEWGIRDFVQVISSAVRDGDSDMRKRLIDSIRNFRFLEEWQKEFAENLKDLTDPDNPATYLLDGTPFLKGEGEEVEPADIHF